MLPSGVLRTNDGIKYSNIDPDQEIKELPRPTRVNVLPKRNQCAAGTSPLAIAAKLSNLASEAIKS
ncbi:hypothetical protein D3C87_1276020 [compost metagenome]